MSKLEGFRYSVGEGTCASCGQPLIVLGNEVGVMLEAVGNRQTRDAFADNVRFVKTPSGVGLALADDTGMFACPHCGAQGQYTALSVN
jgi:predicted RNA-binding Zn-ribbon protein involved in translation (DUF1610 family)